MTFYLKKMRKRFWKFSSNSWELKNRNSPQRRGFKKILEQILSRSLKSSSLSKNNSKSPFPTKLPKSFPPLGTSLKCLQVCWQSDRLNRNSCNSRGLRGYRRKLRGGYDFGEEPARRSSLPFGGSGRNCNATRLGTSQFFVKLLTRLTRASKPRGFTRYEFAPKR